MPQKLVNFPVTLTGHWQKYSPESTSVLSVPLKNWLLDEGSLTARLKSRCKHFKVEVIGEEQQICTEKEACYLIKAGEPILVREVILYCDGIPQVFARSLLPLTSLTGNEKALANLGSQPLGQVLFNNPSLQRQGLEISAFSQSSSVGLLAKKLLNNLPKDILTPEKVALNDVSLWGRRSIFMLENKPLMVAEVFLPAAFAYQESEC